MTTEEHFFLQILSDFLHHRTTELPLDSPNWDILSQIAKKQQMEGIVFYQCQRFIPSSHSFHYAQGYSKTLFFYSNRAALLEELTRILHEENIPYFLVKGSEIAKLYPIPALRTMGDSDLVVHLEDKERVHRILLDLGYKCHTSSGQAEWQYFKNNMEVELHHSLLYNGITTSEKFQTFVNDCWEYVESNELDLNFHFIFLLLHLRKHMIGSGVGFRQFMDLAVVIQQADLLNWDWIYAALNKLGLEKTAMHCFALIAFWFQIYAPEKASLSQEQLNEATQKIFTNGIFGFHDEENWSNAIVNIIHNSKYSLPKKIQSLFRFLFPSYRTVRLYYGKRYSFVDGKPWLLPAAWIYRMLRFVRYRCIRRLKSPFSSQSFFKKRLHILENFGMDEY